MTLQPIVPFALIGALTFLGLLVCVREATRARTAGERLRWWSRTMVVLVLAATCLRPAVPANVVNQSMSNADIFFVVDTTASMAATDGPDGKSRLDLVRADIVAITTDLAAAGSRAALVTFDREARTVVPLTTDAGAVARAAAIVQPEIAVASRGSSVTVSAPLLSRTLTQVAAAYPDRASVVVYMGDGEHTAAAAPTSFVPLRRLAQGGLVVGYGTAAGATMPEHHMTYAQTDQALVLDPKTGQPAVSHADEVRLRGIAGELGLKYVHRDGGPAPAVPAPTVRLVVNEVSDLPGGSTEFTWIGALVLAVLLLGELAGTVVALGRAGLPRRPR